MGIRKQPGNYILEVEAEVLKSGRGFEGELVPSLYLAPSLNYQDKQIFSAPMVEGRGRKVRSDWQDTDYGSDLHLIQVNAELLLILSKPELHIVAVIQISLEANGQSVMGINQSGWLFSAC